MDAIIQVEHLAKRYRTSVVPAVDDISFEVHPGELFAFLGPNGAGKTTTISILTTTLAKTRDRQHAHHRQPRVCPSSSVYLAATSRLLDLRPGGTGRVDHQSETRRGRPPSLVLSAPLQDTWGLPDLRLWMPADPPVRGATAQPPVGVRNAPTSENRAAQMRPTSLVDSEAMQTAST